MRGLEKLNRTRVKIMSLDFQTFDKANIQKLIKYNDFLIFY